MISELEILFYTAAGWIFPCAALNLIPQGVNSGFEYCHTVLIETFDSPLADAFNNFLVVRLSTPNSQFLTNIAALEEKWQERREACQLIYILDARGSKEYCRIQKAFEWIVDCDITDLISKCYGRYTYLISINGGIQIQPVDTMSNCFGSPDQDLRSPISLLPIYELILSNSTLQLITKLKIPCMYSIQTILERQVNSSSAEYWLPSRVLMDSELAELVLNSCPITWLVTNDIGGIPSAEVYTGIEATGTLVLQDSTAVQTLTDIVQVLNLSHPLKPESKFFQLPGKVGQNRFGTLGVKPNVVPKYEGNGRSSEIYLYVYPRKKMSFNFITCAGSHEYITFAGFVQPYSPNLWAVAVICFAFLSIGLRGIFKRQDLEDAAAFFVAKVLLEQDLSLTSKLKHMGGFKWLLASTLFGGIVLTNSYRGQVTTNMMAPMPRSQLETVSEVLEKGLKILLPMKGLGPPFGILQEKEYQENSSNLTLKWEFISLNSLTSSPFLKALMVSLGDNWQSAATIQTKHPRLLESLTPILSPQNLEAALLVELLKCRDTVYIDEILQLDDTFLKFTATGLNAVQHLYYGTDNYMSNPNFWSMGPTLFDRNNLVRNRFQSMIHSGILEWQTEGVETEVFSTRNRVIKFVARHKLRAPVPMSLNSNLLIGIFMLFAIFNTTSAISLVWETLSVVHDFNNCGFLCKEKC